MAIKRLLKAYVWVCVSVRENKPIYLCAVALDNKRCSQFLGQLDALVKTKELMQMADRCFINSSRQGTYRPQQIIIIVC